MSPEVMRERVKERARYVQRKSARSHKAMARATGKHPSTVRHWIDRTEGSPFFTLLLQAGAAVTPWPLVAEAEVMRLESENKWQDTAALVARFHELRDMEHTLQADEDRASQKHDLLAYANAAKAEASAQLELAAIAEVLHARKVDPFEWVQA